MFGLVEAFEDAKSVKLLFEKIAEAKHFVRFVELYIQETAPGNGYSAYWHYKDSPIWEVSRGTSSSPLRYDLIQSMSRDICRKRMALSSDELFRQGDSYYIPSVGMTNGRIRFNFNENDLPSRIKPNVGDLVMVVDLPDYDRVMVRVKAVHNDMVALASGKYCNDIPAGTELPIANVMKIHDFINDRT